MGLIMCSKSVITQALIADGYIKSSISTPFKLDIRNHMGYDYGQLTGQIQLIPGIK